MSERTRTESGKFALEVGDDRILSLLDQEDTPVATATEIAEKVGMTRQAVTRRLKRLHERNIVGRKEVGARAVVWWLTSDAQRESDPITPDEAADELLAMGEKQSGDVDIDAMISDSKHAWSSHSGTDE